MDKLPELPWIKEGRKPTEEEMQTVLIILFEETIKKGCEVCKKQAHFVAVVDDSPENDDKVMVLATCRNDMNNPIFAGRDIFQIALKDINKHV